MLYAVIDTTKGEAAGFARLTHTLLDDGKKMILNENELRKVDDDLSRAAEALGGATVTYGEVINIYKKNKYKENL